MTKRPRFVYHGSPIGDIKVFVPRVSHGTGEKYGALVYAAPDEATASIFMLSVQGHWSAGRTEKGAYVVIPQDRDEFLASTRPGYLYVLSADTFSTQEGRGMGDYEWASTEPVKPIRKIRYNNPLDELLRQGVLVYFVDKDTYKDVVAAGDKAVDVLRGARTENERRGIKS